MLSTNLEPPFRKSLPLSLSEAVKKYISSKYDQHPDMFSADLRTIDQLRMDAINVQEAHVSGVLKLTRYAAHLEWIGGKFPIDIGADFTWYPSLGYDTSKPNIQNNLQFERANILFNLAVLYSKLANQSSVNDQNGLKAACNYYCYGAGTIKYIKEQILPELRSTPPPDMDPVTLACLEELMLAQAQECFWLKAVKDKTKDSLIARLAASVSDHYDRAAEYATESKAITAEWAHHMGAKHHHFAAAAHFRASEDCLQKSKYGEQIRRLMEAVSATTEALNVDGRYLSVTMKGDLATLRDKAREVLKDAEKDNDMIYLDPVPALSQLPSVPRASMVTSKTPKEITEAHTHISDTGIFGSPLFAKLVPFAVHVAAGIYAERRDRLVNDGIIEELETLTRKVHDLLQSLNLPGSLQALEKPLGLPPIIVAHADEVRQQGGMDALIASCTDIDKLKENDRAMYQEAVDLLRAEADEDQQLRLRHGTARWTRPASHEAAGKFNNQIGEYEGILKSAHSSDELVRKKLKDNEQMLRLLSGSINEIEAFVPNSARTQLTAKVDREVNRLRQCLNEVTRLEARRRRKIDQIQQKAKSDDITTAILTETARLERTAPSRKVEAADFEELFAERLEARYGVDRGVIAEEEEEQEELILRLQEANGFFLASRKIDNSLRSREDALQRLESAYLKWAELKGNLETGRKFYNDLAKHLNRWREEVRYFVNQRRFEAGQLEVDITTSMHNMRISQAEMINPVQNIPPPSTPQRQCQHTKQEPVKVTTPGLWQGDATTALKFAPPPS